VLIQVAYAAVNYKDALVCIPNGNVARTYPLVPGLELAGAVVESADPRFQPGDAVLAFDFGSTQGISRHGGFSEFARVPGNFLLGLPHCGGGVGGTPCAGIVAMYRQERRSFLASVFSRLSNMRTVILME